MRHVRMTNCQIMITCHWLIYVQRSISLVMSLEGTPIIRGNYKPKTNCRGGMRWGGYTSFTPDYLRPSETVGVGGALEFRPCNCEIDYATATG